MQVVARETTSRDQIVIYRPNQRHDLGLLKTWEVMVRNIFGAREMIWQLFKRDFFAVYKKSFLGITWVFIGPLVGIVHWVFLQQTGMLNPGDTGIPYPAYVLVATTVWGLFMGFYGSARGTLSAGGGLVMQVKYPREALLFKQTASLLANFSIRFIMIMIALIAFGVIPAWQTILFPLVALPLFFLGSALGLVLSMISIVAVDINRVVSMAMGMLMFITPVIYSDTINNEIVQSIIVWNPLTYLVGSARDIIIYGRLYDAQAYFTFAGITFFLFLIAWRLFYVSEDKIIERMI